MANVIVSLRISDLDLVFQVRHAQAILFLLPDWLSCLWVCWYLSIRSHANGRRATVETYSYSTAYKT
jgi:hypothetical protein